MVGHNQEVGQRGEDRAVAHLISNGYQVLERNWRSPVREVPGELDVIAAKDGVVVICEVKTRLGESFGTPMEAVSQAKSRRLRRLAAVWLSQRSSAQLGADRRDRVRAVRFDVIGVTGGTGDRVQHLTGAF